MKKIISSKYFLSFVSFLFFIIFWNDIFAQMSLYQWRDHLSYKQGIAVAQSSSGDLYCATESGIFFLSKQDFSIERLSKINGLSDIGVSTLRYNNNNNTLLIAYKNANIDLIDVNIS